MYVTPQQPPSAPQAEADPADALATSIGRHIVQFYESDEALIETLRHFIQTGLEAGEACAIIATRAHRRLLEDHLRAAGLDPFSLRRTGQYLSLDADKTLAEFMDADLPDPERFGQVAERIIQRTMRRGRRARLFGEMVAQLWLAGNSEGAVRLEALWNDVQQASASPRFTLLCAYPARLLSGNERSDMLAAVCQQHDDVLPVELTGSPTGSPTATLADSNERLRLIRELAERARELEAVQAITDIALAQPSLDGLLQELLKRTGAILGVDNVAILLPDATGRELRIHMARGPEEEVASGVHVPIGQGVAGTIAATRQPVVIDDLRAATVANPFLRERLRSLMGVPLLVADRLIGVMHASTIAPRHFTARDVRLLRLVAERIALAIERAQLLQAAQQARREADERARQLDATIEAMADGVVVYAGDGRLLRMNAAAHQLLGIGETPPDDAAQTGISRRQVRDSLGHAMPASAWPISRVLRGEVITGAQAVDLIVRAADGHDIELSVSGAPMRDAAGVIAGAVCVFRDVTAQRRLERRTHATLGALLAMASALVDLPPTTPPTTPLDSPLDSPPGALTEAASDALSAGRPLSVSLPAAPVAHRLAQLIREVFDCQRVGIVAIDPETRFQIPIAVVGLAPDAEREWWQSQREHPQRYGDDGADPALLARFEAGEALVIDMTQPPYDSLPNPYGITTTLVAPMRIGAQMIGLFALDFGGAPHSFTEQERALAEAVAQLLALIIERDRILGEREEARASALAAQETTRRMHTFLGIAGHELRTPVTAIKAGVQLSERALRHLLESAPPDMEAQPLRRAQALLERADEQSNRLNRLIEDILDVIRTRTDKLNLHLEPGDLAAVARNAVESQRLAWPAREITLTTPARPVMLAMDADRIEQVIANYLTNALKYSDGQRPVEVEVITRDQRAAPHGYPFARVTVRDHGPGLAPEKRAHLWEPFHQVEGIARQDHASEGLGLGLHICRSLVERHGGSVGVESVVGQGSTFWFELPLTPYALEKS